MTIRSAHHNGISVDDRIHGLNFTIDNQEGRVVLIVHLGVGLLELLQRLAGALEFVGRLAQNLGVPASLHNVSIVLVPVHSHLHATTAGRNQGIEARIADLLQDFLQLVHESQTGSIQNIATISAHVHSDSLSSIGSASFD
ncbi:hypothetical protein Mapa_003370 [Marchantia paleacea]|nr:hypothetical protein Mapa_003370 [Marchantia paleacea]